MSFSSWSLSTSEELRIVTLKLLLSTDMAQLIVGTVVSAASQVHMNLELELHRIHRSALEVTLHL